jgi:hypothetical protein
MAYVSLDQTLLVSGKPVTQDELQTAGLDLDDLNTRMLAVEGSLQTFEPLTFEVLGDFPAIGAQTGVTYKRVHANITLIGCQIFMITDGAGGATNLNLDIQYKRGAGAWTSIFTTTPSVAQGGGDLQTTTGGNVLGTTLLQTGDLLRLDITQVMDGSTGFQVLLPYQKT